MAKEENLKLSLAKLFLLFVTSGDMERLSGRGNLLFKTK
jgi:hypothetical protein